MMNKEQMQRYQVDWHKRNAPGPGVIGMVPKLAQGAINPMHATEASVTKLSEELGPEMAQLFPKRKEAKIRMTSVSSKGHYLIKKTPVDIDSEEDVVG